MLGAVSQSGNTPTMYNPIICFDASDTSASNITESVNLVSLIKDRSGNGIDGVQATGSAQPTTNLHTINGLNTVYMDVGDHLQMLAVATAANLTIICVFKPLGNNNATGAFFSADAADNDFQIDSGAIGQYLGRVLTSNLGSTTAPTIVTNEMGSAILTTYRFSDTDGDVKVRLNGVQKSSDTYNGLMNSSLAMRIGINRALNVSLKLDLAELLIFNQDLSATQIDTIETYLINKWGIV